MSICEKCAKSQKTCCQRSDIILTDGDINRINLPDSYELRKPESYDYDQGRDLNWDKYTLNENREMQLLKRKDNGDCTFLSEKGCALDTDTRPLICRLYPHDYNEEELFVLNPHICPKEWVEKSSDEDIMNELNVQTEKAEAWRQQLYDELKNGAISKANISRD
jgi:Fe-S-cluster containining protein